MSQYMDYKMTIGLEIHAELKTRAKIFCKCKTHYGAPPNSQCCPVCMGFPGALPSFNKEVLDCAVKAGLSLNCRINKVSAFDRKNYFYPDLPKAYQISQFFKPLCTDGYVDIPVQNGTKRISITQIHMEEDAGKLIHDSNGNTLIDCNRCGVPLIEIITHHDFSSSDEVVIFLKKLRSILIYAGVSECKMNRGNLRCDVNLSVSKKGSNSLGTRTETKNLNSFSFVAKAIEYEFKRQVDLIESGGEVLCETRRFDEASGKTFPMRTKETAKDYRFFPEPDLPQIIIGDTKLQELRENLPELAEKRAERYISEYGLTRYDADTIVAEPDISDYFQQAARYTKNTKALANLIISSVFSLLQAEEKIPVSPHNMASLCDLYENGTINSTTVKKVLSQMWQSNVDPKQYVAQNGLCQINDTDTLKAICHEVLQENQKSVCDFKNGKAAAFKALIGKAMAKTGGRANPKLLNVLMEQMLENL